MKSNDPSNAQRGERSGRRHKFKYLFLNPSRFEASFLFFSAKEPSDPTAQRPNSSATQQLSDPTAQRPNSSTTQISRLNVLPPLRDMLDRGQGGATKLVQTTSPASGVLFVSPGHFA
ncbi:hypothetical protein RUM44_011437 [Polyplax serrata]|uniref:Uncharacterized protein n=1 Tax=Polyplax serrata TaxID=468196 RepID=A0ABR1AQ08_POLSC